MKRMNGPGKMGFERRETRFGGSRADWDRDRGEGHCWNLDSRGWIWLHWHPRASPWCQSQIKTITKPNGKDIRRCD